MRFWPVQEGNGWSERFRQTVGTLRRALPFWRAQDTRCNEPGCDREGIECVLGGYNEVPDSITYYCGEHAFTNGFCRGCGNFWAGVESFDFGNGLCDNCDSEACEPEYDEAEDWFDWDEQLP